MRRLAGQLSKRERVTLDNKQASGTSRRVRTVTYDR